MSVTESRVDPPSYTSARLVVAAIAVSVCLEYKIDSR